MILGKKHGNAKRKSHKKGKCWQTWMNSDHKNNYITSLLSLKYI